MCSFSREGTLVKLTKWMTNVPKCHEAKVVTFTLNLL